MKKILLVGAGKSATVLIHFLLEIARKHKLMVIVADNDERMLAAKVKDHPFGEKVVLNVTNETQRRELVEQSELVISLMPAELHILLAEDCLIYKKNLITSSYLSPAMRAMHERVKASGLSFINEMGLDPGIDHMISSKIIHGIQRITGEVVSFKSYCGGLVSPEDDNNPWHYKVSWNPRNIVLAGTSGAQYLDQGQYIQKLYEELFTGNKQIQIDGLEPLSYYANRDSLHYMDLYDIPNAHTCIRGTLRSPDFCRGWDALIRLGMTRTDDRFDTRGMTYHTWLQRRTGFSGDAGMIPIFLAQLLHVKPDSKLIQMLQWLGIWDDLPLYPREASSADILQTLLEDKLKMEAWEKDMVVLHIDVTYMHKLKEHTLTSTMIMKGENRDFSAMAKTVGLPIGILAEMMLTGQVKPPPGVIIPTTPQIYRPVLRGLEAYGITFTESLR